MTWIIDDWSKIPAGAEVEYLSPTELGFTNKCEYKFENLDDNGFLKFKHLDSHYRLEGFKFTPVRFKSTSDLKVGDKVIRCDNFNNLALSFGNVFGLKVGGIYTISEICGLNSIKLDMEGDIDWNIKNFSPARNSEKEEQTKAIHESMRAKIKAIHDSQFKPMPNPQSKIIKEVTVTQRFLVVGAILCSNPKMEITGSSDEDVFVGIDEKLEIRLSPKTLRQLANHFEEIADFLDAEED